MIGAVLFVLPPVLDWLLRNPPWRKPEPPGVRYPIPADGYAQVLLKATLYNELSPDEVQTITQTEGFIVEGGGEFWLPEDVDVELFPDPFLTLPLDYGAPRSVVRDSRGETQAGSWPISNSLYIPKKSGLYSAAPTDPQIGYRYGRIYGIESLRFLGDGSQIRPDPLPPVVLPPLIQPDRPDPDRQPKPGPLLPPPQPKPLKPVQPNPDRQPKPERLPEPERNPPPQPEREPKPRPEPDPQPPKRPEPPPRPPIPGDPPKKTKPNEKVPPPTMDPAREQMPNNGQGPKPNPPAKPPVTPRDQHLTKDGPVTGNGPQPNLEDIARELGRQEQKLARLIERTTPAGGGPLDLGDLLMLLQLIYDLLTNTTEGATYSVTAPCTEQGEDEPKTRSFQIPDGLNRETATIARLDAIAYLLQEAQLMTVKTCNRNTRTPGNNVTVTAFEVVQG